MIPLLTPPRLLPMTSPLLTWQGGVSPLHLSALYGYLEVVERLLQDNAHVNEKDNVRPPRDHPPLLSPTSPCSPPLHHLPFSHFSFAHLPFARLPFAHLRFSYFPGLSAPALTSPPFPPLSPLPLAHLPPLTCLFSSQFLFSHLFSRSSLPLTSPSPPW